LLFSAAIDADHAITLSIAIIAYYHAAYAAIT